MLTNAAFVSLEVISPYSALRLIQLQLWITELTGPHNSIGEKRHWNRWFESGATILVRFRFFPFCSLLKYCKIVVYLSVLMPSTFYIPTLLVVVHWHSNNFITMISMVNDTVELYRYLLAISFWQITYTSYMLTTQVSIFIAFCFFFLKCYRHSDIHLALALNQLKWSWSIKRMAPTDKLVIFGILSLTCVSCITNF